MNRHVIKGRGENRGKYLCWGRMAPAEKPTEDGFVWLSEQRKAARWEDPGYRGHTWATERARVHNGYFVKLVGRASITREAVDEMRAFIARHAAGAREELACHWFGGDFHDAGEDFCWECATKVVDEKYAADPKQFEALFGQCDDEDDRYREAIDGGFDIDHDSTPFCEKCGAKLSGYLTEYGADQEIIALTTYAAPDFDDVEGWAELDHALTNVNDDDPRWHKIAKIIETAKAGEQAKADREAALTASPGMTEARAGLLSVFAARQEQKAPEPSYRLWPEFLRYRALPFEKRVYPSKKTAAWERRLWKEAKSFLALLGIEPSGDCFDAPYGAYHWPFVVEIEQYRLWQTPAFLEGQAYVRCPSGAPGESRHRDANPYPDNTEAHRQWDAGYIGASEVDT